MKAREWNPFFLGMTVRGFFSAFSLLVLFTGATQAQWESWHYSTRISFNTTSTGANVSSNITNFPLLVKLDSNNFYFDQAKTDGSDLRFVDPDGTTLSYEIERYSPSLGKAEIWVKVPQVDGNSSQDYITLYWGNASASAVTSGSSVFSSYKLVYHLTESPGASAPQFTDASGNANNGTAQGGATGDSISAQVGKGYKLNGSSKYISTTTQFVNPTSLTASCWFKTTMTTGGKIFGFGDAKTGASAAFDRHVYMNDNGTLTAGVWNGAENSVTTTAAYNDGKWHHVAFRFGASGVYLYIDGSVVNSNASYTSVSTITGYWKAGYDVIGVWSGTHTGTYFNGSLDEFRVMHSELSSDWLKLSYETQKSNSYALTYDNMNLSAWSYSSKVYLNTTSAGANITGNLSNYPLLIRLTNANFDFSQAKSNGGDLRFTDSAGNLLPYEIERFDATSKKAEIWVLIPTVVGNNNSQYFKMYWGRNPATTLSSGNGVFSSTNSYQGVWHLSEEAAGTGTAALYKDATPNALDGDDQISATDQTGIIGYGQDFDGTDDRVTLGVGSLFIPSTSTNITVSAWFNADAFTASSDANRIFSIPKTDSNSAFSLSVSGNGGSNRIDVYNGSATNRSRSTLSASTWTHAGVTWDGTTFRVYLNGILDTSYTGTLTAGTAALARIGIRTTNAYNAFDGHMDEVRFSRSALSADWLKLDYESQKSGSTVVTAGFRSVDYSKSLLLNFNTTASGANVANNVTNIPLLVRLTSANFDFSAARSDGGDMLFIDKDGSRLYHQVMDFDPKNQTASVWVKVPQVDGNSKTDFMTLYYGCSACASNSQARSDSVFSAYAGVYHLNDPRSQAFDATANAYQGTYFQSQAFGPGVVSYQAASFDGTGDYVQTTAPTTAGTRTFEAWVYPRTSDDVSEMETVIDGEISGQFGGGFGLDNGYFKVLLDNQWWTTTKTVTLNTWQHVALRFNASKAVLFVDGVARDSTTYTQGSITSTTLRIGRSAARSFYFDGLLNEVRAMDAYQSTDYIKLSYENQKSGSTLFSTTTINASSFQKSKIFKFNTTASGANITGDVYNFPLLLRITGSAICDAVQSNAPDIRFLDGDGVTWLDYEIERWNQTKDSAEVWVKVPKIDGNSAGDFITMYYQQASGVTVPDGQCAACVFSSSNKYLSTWHLNTSGTGSRPDATGNGNNLSTGGYDNDEFKGGIIAGADSLDGTNDYLYAPSGMSDFTAGFTYTGWAYWASTGSYARLFDFGNGSPSDNLYFSRSGTAATGEALSYYNTSSNGAAYGTSLSTGVWAHFAVTFNGNSLKVYKNGSLSASGTLTIPIRNVTRSNNYFGRSNWADAYFQGKYDEVAIANVERDANWIKLCYQTQRYDAAPFFNPSPADFNSSQKYTFNTTKTGAYIADSVTNFPLLVRITGTTICDAVQGAGTSVPTDIRFLDGDGVTWLDYQVERWDRTKDTAEVWVMVPQVDGNSNNDFITLYYDDVSNGSLSDGQCATCVFNTSNGWKAAWHFNGNVTDATGGYNGTDNSTSDAAGIIARSRSFNGTSSYIAMGNPQIHANTAYTLMAWVKGASAQNDKRIFGEGNTGTTTPMVGIGTDVGASNGKLDLWYRNDANTIELNHVQSTGSPFDGNWHHIAVADSAGSYVIYIDGTASGSGSYTKGTKTMNNFTVGAFRYTSTISYFNGSIDEANALTTKLSADQVKLTYETQKYLGTNVFWNGRPGPNNKATLTATPSNPNGGISLSWNSSVSDSSNADSVGIWVKYSAYPDSANAASTTVVARLSKTDTTYTYPAAYPGSYYFALAVRNSSGKWSPFTKASSALATLSGSSMPDTVYVDSAIGSDGNSCASAKNPATPKLTITSALTCGASASDTLEIRVMPGTYANDNAFSVTSSKPSVVMSFDKVTRAVLAGYGTVTENSKTWGYAVSLNSSMTLRRMDVKATSSSNTHIGVYVKYDADSVIITGNRIYGASSYAFDSAIVISGNNCEGVLVANNLVYSPNKYGLLLLSDDRANILHNAFYGSGGTSKGIYMPISAWLTGYFNITNNVFYNWNYGIHTLDSDSEIGNVSNNLFHQVTSGQEVVGETDPAKVVKDPLFANTTLGHPNAFKLLPGSPAIDAGTATLLTGGSTFGRVAAHDYFGSSRISGAAPDIGLYEGSGYTQTATGDFDSLTITTTSNTVTVKNTKWKLIFDKARGGGINFFSDLTDSSTNLLASNSLLFDVNIDGYIASSQTGNTIAPSVVWKTRTACQVLQRLAVSASLDLYVYYTVQSSGHVFVQSELVNLTSSSAAVATMTFTAKVGTAASAATSGGTNRGYGYLLTSSRDVLFAATHDLDTAAAAAETWTQTSASGASGYVRFATTDLADLPGKFRRRHPFLLYLGDGSLTANTAAAVYSDVISPSALTVYNGSPLHVHSWQSQLMGHWSFDEGGGTTLRDNSVYQSNNGTLTSMSYVSAKWGAGGSFTNTSEVSVTSHSSLQAKGYFTLALWVKPVWASIAGTVPYVLWKGATTTDGYSVQKVSGQEQVTFRMGSGTVTVGTPTSVWTHLAFVVDAGQIYAYVNGVLKATGTTNASTADNTDALKFGDATGGDKFYGTLDDIRVYASPIPAEEIQAMVRQGFARKDGLYHLRADNNNRVVAALNPDAAATRMQPAFLIDNWYAGKTPKYVYLDGTRLKPNVDFVSDTVAVPFLGFGSRLCIQMNKAITSQSANLFIDDDDSSGYLGATALMPKLTVTTTTGSKIAIKNFSDTTFGAINSRQWYLEIGLSGGTSWGSANATTTGFGGFNVWKAAATDPGLAISSATNLTSSEGTSGTSLVRMKFDNSGAKMYEGGAGHAGPATYTYTVVDSSAVRFSLVLSNTSLQSSDGTATLSKRWTIYPNGRVFGNFTLSSPSFNMDQPRIDFIFLAAANDSAVWGATTATSTARMGFFRGTPAFHSLVGGVTSIKSSGSTTTLAASNVSSTNYSIDGSNWDRTEMNLQSGLFESADTPITTNFFFDISRDFTDSATADSLAKDVQTPAAIAAITGTAVTNDALDFNADGFAEGDGAYVFQANGSGLAQFTFSATVPRFNPAFRIKNWTFGTLPDYVFINNQTMVQGYDYNAYVDVANSTLVLQFNRTLTGGSKVIYISHKSGLAVTLRRLSATPGPGVDTVKWTTESEIDNYGYHLWRRVKGYRPQSGWIVSSLSGDLESAKLNPGDIWVGQAARTLGTAIGGTGQPGDTVPELRLQAPELLAEGWRRINQKIIPGAPEGRSSSTREYAYVDAAVESGTVYEYILEALDTYGQSAFYGSVESGPEMSLVTGLQGAYPNPFNPVTTLRFTLATPEKVSLVIYNASGQVVRTLVRPDRPLRPGRYRLYWDTRTDRGEWAASGPYFYRFKTTSMSASKKMIFLK